MNIAAIARDSEFLADTAAERTIVELAGNDLLGGTRQLSERVRLLPLPVNLVLVQPTIIPGNCYSGR